MSKNMEKVVIFGAERYGAQALQEIGKDKVACFLDNDKNKWGTEYFNLPVYGINDYKEKFGQYPIYIASAYADDISNELKKNGIDSYTTFFNKNRKYYETDELIYNPYIAFNSAKTEEEWNIEAQHKYAQSAIYNMVEKAFIEKKLFNHIEIETYNRCNGTCSFCPVNHNIDPRIETKMTEGLFKKIVGELEEINYDGRFTTFSNNEPLLDDRIIEWNQYARDHLPHSRMHLFTNGTLMTITKFKALAEVLDELIIDNYQQELKLIKPCQEIAAYCKDHPELNKKVTIVLRKPQEILTSRGGTAPNRKEIRDFGDERCVLPFKQMIIRPDGKVSLCCNDAIGRYTLGDVSKNSLQEVWFGEEFQRVRESLYKGRKYWGTCSRCDTFSMG